MIDCHFCYGNMHNSNAHTSPNIFNSLFSSKHHHPSSNPFSWKQSMKNFVMLEKRFASNYSKLKSLASFEESKREKQIRKRKFSEIRIALKFSFLSFGTLRKQKENKKRVNVVQHSLRLMTLHISFLLTENRNNQHNSFNSPFLFHPLLDLCVRFFIAFLNIHCLWLHAFCVDCGCCFWRWKKIHFLLYETVFLRIHLFCSHLSLSTTLCAETFPDNEPLYSRPVHCGCFLLFCILLEDKLIRGHYGKYSRPVEKFRRNGQFIAFLHSLFIFISREPTRKWKISFELSWYGTLFCRTEDWMKRQ